MKKILVMGFILFSLIGSLSAQTLDNKPISELDEDYIEIIGTSKFLKLYEVTITVNYGQVGTLKDIRKSQVFDESGKLMTFNGMMGAVNLFAKFGYELDLAYPLSIGNQLVYHYIMKKKSD